jgi:protein SCO1/2
MNFRCELLAALSTVLGLIANPLLASAHSLESLQQDLFKKEQYFQIKDEPTPDFALQSAEGKPVALGDFKGKVIVLHFIYTRCPDVCPLHAEKVAEIQKRINITPMKDQVEFISITTDPENDTPDVLRSYGPLHGLVSTNWLFLTKRERDPEDATRKLAERFGHGFDTTKDGLQIHGLVTHVIDQSGRWRGNFHGLQFSSLNLVNFVNGLINTQIPHHDESNESIWNRIRSWF